jgi:ribosomal protein S18 acetylase RimI-like enzyme
MRIHGVLTPAGDLCGFLASLASGLGGEPLIEYLCVAESSRNQGLGSKLITFFEDVLFPDADNLYLFVSDINPNAIRLYVRLGYQQIGAMPNFNLESQTEFLHRKSRRPRQDAQRLEHLRDR